MSKEIIIIGAGPGGLAAAILLAASGRKVRILERMSTVGGRTSAIEAEGFRFDLGPTFFLYPRILDEIFRAAGTTLQTEVEMIRLDPQYRIQFGAGGHLDCTPDIAEMERQIARLAPEDCGGFARFLHENRKKLELMEPCLETGFDSWRGMLNGRILKALPMLRPHQSLDSYLKRFFKDERVRLAFCFQSKYLGMSPFRCPSLFSILSFLEYEHGVWHPLGGCSAITEAMARVARRLGVEICLNEDVEQIDFEGRRATGVRTLGGSHYRADALVINADFARAMQRLVPDRMRRRWTNRRIESKKFSCSTFMLYLGIEGRYDMPHHTIHIAKDYAKNLDEIENQHVLSSDPSLYVQNACVTDASLAPAGHSTLYVLVPVPHRHAQIDWAKECVGFRKRVLRQMEEAGFKGIEGRIRYEKIITPTDWETGYEIHRGATFNLAHTLDQMLHLRPHNRFEDVEGVYLVGGGTHPGSGLPVIFEGARISTLKLLNDLAADSHPRTPLHTDQAAKQSPQLTPHEEIMAAFSAGTHQTASR